MLIQFPLCKRFIINMAISFVLLSLYCARFRQSRLDWKRYANRETHIYPHILHNVLVLFCSESACVLQKSGINLNVHVPNPKRTDVLAQDTFRFRSRFQSSFLQLTTLSGSGDALPTVADNSEL